MVKVMNSVCSLERKNLLHSWNIYSITANVMLHPLNHLIITKIVAGNFSNFLKSRSTLWYYREWSLEGCFFMKQNAFDLFF